MRQPRSALRSAWSSPTTRHWSAAGSGSILKEAGITVAAEAANGTEAVTAVLQHRPDVVLMDIRMPVMDGLEATRRILASKPGYGCRIIILTTFDLDQYVYAALTAGASGFLLKDTSPEQLVAAVRMVRSGDALLAPSITRRLIERFAPHQPGQFISHAGLSEPDGARTPGTAAAGPRAQQRRAGRRTDAQHRDGQDPCGQHPRQAAATGPGPGHRPRLPDRTGRPAAQQSGPRRTVILGTAPPPQQAWSRLTRGKDHSLGRPEHPLCAPPNSRFSGVAAEQIGGAACLDTADRGS